MTVRELIAKLSELPEHLKDLPLLVERDERGKDELQTVRVQVGQAKIWWEPDAIVLSSEL